MNSGGSAIELLDKYLLAWTKEICSRDDTAAIHDDAKLAQEKMPENAVYLSDLIVIAECLTAAVAILKPYLINEAKGKETMSGQVLLGTIEGDVHDIGRQIIGTMFTAAGYDVTDLGADVPAQRFALQAKLKKADILGISCSMAMCRSNIPKVVEQLKKMGIRDNVKVIDGGQAATPDDPATCNIDGFAAQSEEALTKAFELMRILKEQRAKGGKQ